MFSWAESLSSLFGGLDGIQISDDVGNGDVGSGELFHVALLAREVGEGQVVSLFGNPPLAGAANGKERIVVDFAARDTGHLRVQKFSESSQDAALGLPAQPQENEIVLGQESIDDSRHHRILVADDAREEFLATGEFSNQIVAQLILDGSITGRLSLLFEFSKRCWLHRVTLEIRRVCRV